MRIIIGDRQTGKTQTLIRLCAEAEANGEVSYIVCHNRREAYRIAKLAEELNLKIGFPITYDEFLNLRGRSFITRFFIDNADYLLKYLTPYTIDTVTINTIKEENE
jgi:hypothetical protein